MRVPAALLRADFCAMDAALAARFAETDAQRAEAEAEGMRLCTESILAAQRSGFPSRSETKVTRASARKGQRRILCRLYRALETGELGGQPMQDLEIMALMLRGTNKQDSPDKKLAFALAAADEHRLELHGAALSYAVAHDVHDLALHTTELTCLVLQQLQDAACAGGADSAECAAAAGDSVAQLARTGGLEALAALAADARPGSPVLAARGAVACLHQAVTCLYEDRTSEDDRVKAAAPAILAACTTPPFLARLPVHLGGSLDSERSERAACLLDFVVYCSDEAGPALLAPDARPALLPLLVAALWDKRYDSRQLRQHATRTLAQLMRVGDPAAVASLVPLRALDAAVDVLFTGVGLHAESAQELVAAFARTPVLRPAVVQAPAALHRLASGAAAQYRVPATQSAANASATKAIALLISDGDAATAALASAALRAAGTGGAAALADMAARDARVAAALAAPECAPEAAAAALQAATRRIKHYFREKKEDGRAELALMAEPDGEAEAEVLDEVKQIALRRAALMLCASVQAVSWEQMTDAGREYVAHQARNTAAVGGQFMGRNKNRVVLGTRASTYSTGLFATLRSPELYLHVADDARAQARDGLSAVCCLRLADLLEKYAFAAVIKFMEAQPGADARRGLFLREGLTIGGFDAIALLFEACGGEEGPPDMEATLRAADAQLQGGIYFRFEEPVPGLQVAAAMSDTYGSLSFLSIAALTYSTKLTHFHDYDLAQRPVPVLFCDVRACLARIKAAADRGFPAPARLLEILHALYPPVDSAGQAAEAVDDCSSCVHCRARRFNGTMCARPGCSQTEQPEGGSLRRCARCRLRAYCGPLCQQMDWRRHKKEDCAAKAGATPASAGEAS